MTRDEAARDYGRRAARKLFEGRTGHGHSAAITRRVLSEAQLAAICAAAFEAGCTVAGRSKGN